MTEEWKALSTVVLILCAFFIGVWWANKQWINASIYNKKIICRNKGYKVQQISLEPSSVDYYND